MGLGYLCSLLDLVAQLPMGAVLVSNFDTIEKVVYLLLMTTNKSDQTRRP